MWGGAPWLGAHEPPDEGDLTRKRSFRLQLPRQSDPPSLPLPAVRVGLPSDHSSPSLSSSLAVMRGGPRRCPPWDRAPPHPPFGHGGAQPPRNGPPRYP